MATAPSPQPRTDARHDPPPPPHRHMTVVAQDPGVRRHGKVLMAKVAIPAEDLLPGPIGYRVQVVDYDSTARQFYGSHRLPTDYDREPAEWSRGDVGLVRDRRFHAQNVYALIMRTLSRFEFALGRRLGWSFRTHQLKVAPHGMVDANAFYSPAEEGLVFGYFEGLSGNSIFTCLSHDVIVHETTHALLDGLRERYLYPSNPDQTAFHEGFADVVAVLSVFSLAEVIAHLLQPSRGNANTARLIRKDLCSARALRKSALFGLAEEMGRELSGVRGSALRRSTEIPADPANLEAPEFLEPHRRGEIFVAAVLDTFIEAWAARIAQSGVRGQTHYPLMRVIEEGADIAEVLATMWIRALDYMPPVHLEFSDTLSAVLTADLEVRPDDTRYGLREHLTKCFAVHGIKPASACTSPKGIWNAAPGGLRYERVRFESMQSDKDEVFRFLWENRDSLQIRPGAYTEVCSVRPCRRTGMDGFVLHETVVEYYQVGRLTPAELKKVGIDAPKAYLDSLRGAQRVSSDDADDGSEGEGDVMDGLTPLYGGGVLLFDEYGKLKYAVNKDVFGSNQSRRLEYLWQSGQLEARDGSATYRGARLSALHRLRATDARRSPAEGW